MLTEELQSNHRFASSQKMLSPLFRIALLLGVCVHLAGFFVFRVISNPLPKREKSSPFVQYVSPETLLSGAALEEQAALLDSAPLFVPSAWNAAHNLEPPSRERAFQFSAYEPEIRFSEALLPDRLPFAQNYDVESPVDLLAWRYWDFLRGFAAEVAAPMTLQATGAFAELRELNGKVRRTVPVAIDLLSMQASQPVIYFLRVEAGGRTPGRPTLSTSSGDLTFDAAAYTWIVESGFSSGLPVGLFEVSVYPE